MSICFSIGFPSTCWKSVWSEKKENILHICSMFADHPATGPFTKSFNDLSIFQPGLNASFEQPRIGMQALQERFWAYTVQRHLKMFMWQKCCIGTSHRIVLDVSQCCSWVVSQFEQTAAVKARPDTNSATKHHWRHFCKMLTSAWSGRRDHTCIRFVTCSFRWVVPFSCYLSNLLGNWHKDQSIYSTVWITMLERAAGTCSTFADTIFLFLDGRKLKAKCAKRTRCKCQHW